MKKFPLLIAIASFFAFSAASARAQQQSPAPESASPEVSGSAAVQTTAPSTAPATSAKPASNQGAASSTPGDTSANPKNSRIFMVIPNYTTVEKPTDFMPITVKEKFKLGADDAFDPYSFPLAAIVAGIAQADNDDASWGQRLKGYGKRYAAGYADTVLGSFMTTGVYPSLLHEDPRYFRKGHGGFWNRSGYAVSRLFVTRTDSGGNSFNISEFAGNATAGAISLTYHSREDRNFTNFLSDFGTQVSIDFVANQLKEFWPDMRRKVFHR